MGMDINIIKYINDNFNTLSLEPVFISKNKFNVPEYLYNNLNKTLRRSVWKKRNIYPDWGMYSEGNQ